MTARTSVEVWTVSHQWPTGENRVGDSHCPFPQDHLKEIADLLLAFAGEPEALVITSQCRVGESAVEPKI
jgi:hypothetical protein